MSRYLQGLFGLVLILLSARFRAIWWLSYQVHHNFILLTGYSQPADNALMLVATVVKGKPPGKYQSKDTDEQSIIDSVLPLAPSTTHPN